MADASNFKYRSGKMFLLKLGSELQNLVQKFQSVRNCTLNFLETKWNAHPGHLFLLVLLYLQQNQGNCYKPKFFFKVPLSENLLVYLEKTFGLFMLVNDKCF